MSRPEDEQPVPYVPTAKGWAVPLPRVTLAELAEQVAAVPRTVLRGQGVGNQAVVFAEPVEGAVS